MDLEKLVDVLEATVIVKGKSGEIRIESVCASDLMSDVLTFIQPGALLLTGLANSHVIRTLEMSEIDCVCFVRGKQPQDDAVALARQKHMTLLTTKLSMFDACGRLHAEGMASGCVM